MCRRQCGHTGWDKVCMHSKAVCGYVSIGDGWYLLELLLFTLSPSWLCNMNRERAMAPKCRVGLAQCCTIPRVPLGSKQAQTHCQPIHKQEDEESKTNSPSFLDLKDYLVWPLLSFLVLLSTRTPHCTFWPHVDLTTHFETDLMDGLGPGHCLGSFSKTTLCELGH